MTLPIPGAEGNGAQRWWPSECDVPIRKGEWFFHTDGEHKLRSLEELLEIYYRSVGLGTVLLLNVSPDRRGLLPEADTKRLLELWQVISETFKDNLAKTASVQTSHVRGNANDYAPQNLLDDATETYWATDDDVRSAWVEFDFGKEITFDRFVVQEHIPLGQRIAGHQIQVFLDNAWKTVATGTTIGYKRIHRLPATKAAKVRLQITETKAAPVLESIGIYKASAQDLVAKCPQPSL